MAAFFQHESAGMAVHPAPVAHEKRTMVGRDMLICFKRCNWAKHTCIKGFAQVCHML